MNKENFKEMMIQLLQNDKQIYKTLSEVNNTIQPYKEMVKAIKIIIKHIEEGIYDEQIEAYCNSFEDEILKEADEEIQKSKKRTKKKAE